MIKEPEYFSDGIFRYVKPYEHLYVTYIKRRWINSELLQVLHREFKAYSLEYYVINYCNNENSKMQ